MKKVIYAFLISSMILATTACASGTAKKAIEESKMSMASADYETALNYLNLAKNEGIKDKEVDNMILILDSYIKAKEAFEASDIDGANKALAAIPSDYKEYVIAKDIDSLKADISSKNTSLNNIDAQIKGVKKMLADGDYVSVSANIMELYSMNLTDEQKKQVEEIESTLKSAQSKIADAKATGAVQQRAVSSNTNVVATYYVVNCKQSITLRTSPSTSASEITQIPLGQAVGYIENAGNGFYKINYDGAVGYALASYLSSSKDTSYSSSYTTAQVVNAKEFITLRSTPSTSASEITKIPAGAYVTYLGNAENGFYFIEYNGMRGYGLQSYLQLQ